MKRHAMVILTVLMFVGLVAAEGPDPRDDGPARVNQQVARTIVDDTNPQRGGAVDLVTTVCSIYDDPDIVVDRFTRTVSEGPDPVGDALSALCGEVGAVFRSPNRDCVTSGSACAIAGAVYCTEHGDLLSAVMNPDPDIRYNACAITCTDGNTSTADRCQPDPNLACLLPGEQGPCEDNDMQAGTGRPGPKERADQR